jgi:hypothetical protein
MTVPGVLNILNVESPDGGQRSGTDFSDARWCGYPVGYIILSIGFIYICMPFEQAFT